jgi:hypothetical protein
MCWRALVPVERTPLPFVSPDASFWMGPKAHVVTYYVKGGAAVNIVAVNESAQLGRGVLDRTQHHAKNCWRRTTGWHGT